MLEVPIDVAPLLRVLANTGGDTSALSAELEKDNAWIADMKSFGTMNVRRHEELMHEVK